MATTKLTLRNQSGSCAIRKHFYGAREPWKLLGTFATSWYFQSTLPTFVDLSDFIEVFVEVGKRPFSLAFLGREFSFTQRSPRSTTNFPILHRRSPAASSPPASIEHSFDRRRKGEGADCFGSAACGGKSDSVCIIDIRWPRCAAGLVSLSNLAERCTRRIRIGWWPR